MNKHVLTDLPWAEDSLLFARDGLRDSFWASINSFSTSEFPLWIEWSAPVEFPLDSRSTQESTINKQKIIHTFHSGFRSIGIYILYRGFFRQDIIWHFVCWKNMWIFDGVLFFNRHREAYTCTCRGVNSTIYNRLTLHQQPPNNSTCSVGTTHKSLHFFFHIWQH